MWAVASDGAKVTYLQVWQLVLLAGESELSRCAKVQQPDLLALGVVQEVRPVGVGLHVTVQKQAPQY